MTAAEKQQRTAGVVMRQQLNFSDAATSGGDQSVRQAVQSRSLDQYGTTTRSADIQGSDMTRMRSYGIFNVGDQWCGCATVQAVTRRGDFC